MGGDLLADLQNVKCEKENEKLAPKRLEKRPNLSRLLGMFLHRTFDMPEIKKPNVLKIVENYFSGRWQLFAVFSGDS